MGKGKKNKKKEEPKTEELPSVAALAVSESEPSTSGAPEAAPGSGDVPAAKPAPEPAEEEDEGGLGLGKSRKKKKKKPKDATPAPVSKETTPSPMDTGEAAAGPSSSGAVPVEPTPKTRAKWGARTTDEPQQVPSQYAQQPVPVAQMFPPQGPPGFPQVAPPGFAAPPGYPQSPPDIPTQPSQPAGFPDLRGQGMRAPPVSQQGFPGLGQTTSPAAQLPSWSGAQPSWGQPGAGRGFGRGQAPPQSRVQQTPQPRMQPTSQPQMQPISQPQMQPTSQPQMQPIPSSSSASLPHEVTSQGERKPPSATSSRFKIPDKIIGKRVPGRRINVLANYLPMTIKPLQIHRYDVSFKPDKPKKFIPRAFLAVKGMHFPKSVLAFDQMKNCYSLMPLPKVPQSERFTTNVELLDNNGRKVKFEVSIKATGVVNLSTIMEISRQNLYAEFRQYFSTIYEDQFLCKKSSNFGAIAVRLLAEMFPAAASSSYMRTGGSTLSPPTEAIQCVDVILRQGTLESYIKAGRQFFKRPDNPIDLGDGLEMWTGLFQSAIFTCRAFINIDVAHKGFPRQQPLIEAMQKDFRLDLNSPIERQRGFGVEAFTMFLKNLRVMASIGGDSSASGQRREFICNELVDPPGRIKFKMTDQATGREKEMTVADYFAREKNVRLRYPNLNCMWVGPRDKKIYYPLELLEVSYGQALNKQLNERQLSTMVREAATPPNVRKRKIEEVIRDMNYARNKYFKDFGLEIQDKFLEVEAKVLAAPELDVGGQRPVQPSNGSWQANRLLKPEPLSSWAIISIELDVQKCSGENVVSMLKSCGHQLGMNVAEPAKRYYGIDMRKLKEVLFEALALHIKFLVIIVPTRGRDYYHRVKQMAEREIGILTQCIREQTATRRMNAQTARNILLKVNSKLMGINQALDKRSMPLCLASGGVMVVGADVTHPSPDQTSVPSIAAVTASIDPKCFIYNIQLSIQTPKKEMIVEFEDMMVEHLQVYKKHQGGLPRKIFVFRDGVSEGQFAQVMNSELQAVHRAYQRMTGNNTKPEVLFLLVQKRHHTRFFHTDSRKESYNVEPGTVVDTHIVHAKELDFYLAIKGTARPTRYHAVCNDGGIPHDEVEQLTYYLCHLYSRCMRAVSYPTPTYYAHLACLRARSLTYGEKFNNQDLERNPKRLNVLDKMLEFSRMFFV